MTGKLGIFLLLINLLTAGVTQQLNDSSRAWVQDATQSWQQAYSQVRDIIETRWPLDDASRSDLLNQQERLASYHSDGLNVTDDILEQQRVFIEANQLIPESLQYLEASVTSLNTAIDTLQELISALSEDASLSKREAKLSLQVSALSYTIYDLSLTMYFNTP